MNPSVNPYANYYFDLLGHTEGTLLHRLDAICPEHTRVQFRLYVKELLIELSCKLVEASRDTNCSMTIGVFIRPSRGLCSIQFVGRPSPACSTSEHVTVLLVTGALECDCDCGILSSSTAFQVLPICSIHAASRRVVTLLLFAMALFTFVPRSVATGGRQAQGISSCGADFTHHRNPPEKAGTVRGAPSGPGGPTSRSVVNIYLIAIFEPKICSNFTPAGHNIPGKKLG